MVVEISTYLQAAGAFNVSGLPRSTSSGLRQLYTNALALFALQLPGDFVETGVFHGATSIAMMRILHAKGSSKRHFACDSFDGLPDAVAADHSCQHQRGSTAKGCVSGAGGAHAFKGSRDEFEEWVRREHLMRYLHVVQGWFNESLPPHGLRQISFLRLDGDMYESTIAPLRTLYPLVAPGGVIYIDDYGSYAGCAAAVHEYFKEQNIGEPHAVLQPIVEFGGSKLGVESVWFQKPGWEQSSAERLTGAPGCWKHGDASCRPGGAMDLQLRLGAKICADARQRDGYAAEYMRREHKAPLPWQCPPGGQYKAES